MVEKFALVVVVLAGLYLIGLGVVSLITPNKAKQFLLGFVGSASTHYLELALRLLVGGAFVLQAPRMLHSDVFSVLGWIVIVTTACLLVVPWRWHQRFAKWSVPQAVRALPFIAVASLALGGFVVFAALV